MSFSTALNPRRIARSLTAVLTLTLLQTVAAPIVAPTISVPKSSAVSGTFTASSSTSRSFITIPAGVESITLTITGGGGGQGGSDGDKAGGKGGMAQRVVATFAVTPGDVVSLFPGNAGSNGTSAANINTGGTGVGGAVAGGASTVTDSYWNVNDISYQNPSFSGGGGGKVGANGSSGSGGGGGAASVVAINRRIVAIAGGAGGGGGAGNATGAQGTDGVDANTPHSNLMYGGVGKDSGAGLTCSATDGGGGGGGGGGYLAGTGGNSELVGNECSGRGGYRGNALVYNALSSTVSSFNTSATPASPLNGSITYSYDVKSPSACTPTSTNVDIYTVLKFDASVNCTWTVPSNVSVIDIFAVGGGGGGGHDGGTGGGGGAALSRTAVAVNPNSSMTIRVGYGGRGGLFNAWESDFGETSTVTTSTGATYNAPGGGAGGSRVLGGGLGGSGAVNGTFAGGAGGTYPSQGAVGGVGKFGVSNYFFGTQNTYAGGGGGGCYFDNYSEVAGALGRNGGGAGCANTLSGGQVDATNGTAGTGGGGGAGGAGPAGRVIAGKGGSGVVLIRYATNSSEAFPASLSSSLYARFAPNDLQVLDPAREALIDSAGRNAPGVVNGSPYIFNRGTTDGVNSTRSSKTLMSMKGVTTDSINLLNLPSDNYTMFHVARYVTGGATGRLFSASSGNWISGFYAGMNGCAHHNAWLTSSGCNSDYLYGWELSMDQLQYYRHNGEDVTLARDANDNGNNYINAQSRSNTFGINNFSSGQKADWEVADVIVFDRKLTPGEIRLMETYLARIYGLTLDSAFGSNETDTAVSMNGAYYYGQYASGFYLNDTFTLQAWVKPKASCVTSYCSLFSYEGVLVTKIEGGIFKYALYGSSTAWVWASTGFVLPTDEWHHVTLVKKLVGNQANAIDFYVDGKLVYTDSGSPYNEGSTSNSLTDVVRTNDTWYYLGVRSGEGANYRGLMDEVKVWKVARTASEIASDLHSNDPTSPQLQLYYDFNQNSLSNSNDLRNLAFGGPSRSDMVAASGPHTYVDVKETTVSAPYTTITFPRTYITQNGGWTVPSNISLVHTVVVGGGGGGGGGYEGGGGGAGGFIETVTGLTSGTIYPIRVGTGGRGTKYPLLPTNGETSTAFGITTLGGGSGAVEFNDGGVNRQYSANSGGSGGGGSWADYLTGAAGTEGQGNKGGNSSLLNESACGTGNAVFVGGGGGGATTAGQDASCLKGGNGGAGKASTVLGTTVAAGGGGSVRPFSRTINSTFQGLGGSGGGGNSAFTSGAAVGATGGATNGAYGTGSGGGAGYAADGFSGYGGGGGTGIVALRFITASKPSYTKPTTANLNVGMTETFTTNVALDSATVGLTRTFVWESTTPNSNGAYTLLKRGTGAANAAFSWVPTDTSTSGSGYLYRLTVTDSDTAGLFITDSSTAFAIINPAMVISSTANSGTLAKRINLSRSETFTITLGTPTYRATLSPVIPGITLDTSTAGIAVLRIGDTATVGTWLETLTVTDSVSSVINVPLTIVVAAPPNLLNTNEIVTNGLVLNLDAGNSASLIYAETTTATNSIWRDISGNGKNAQTSGTFDSSRTCTAPVYSPYNSGYLNFNGSTDCYWSPYIGYQMEKSFTLETWFRLNSSQLNLGSSIISQNYTSGNINFVLGDMLGNRTITVAFYDGTWRQCATGFTPVNGVWNHIVGTYNGANMILYVNGTQFCTVAYTGGLSTSVNTQGTWIGRRHDGGSTYYLNGSVATARVYRVALSAQEVATNYNATKDRFANENVNAVIPSKKYGTSLQDSFTVTSGYETRTVTFTTGTRSGILWDKTSIANRVTLTMQESLTVGTYLDTVTVADSLGQSTFLPIRMTVTKADTLTVSMESATVVTYNGKPISTYPKPIIKGLKGFDTATSLTRFASSLYTETTTVPTNADTYTVRGAIPVFTVGLLSNYEGVIYETTTAVVNKARQRALDLNLYGGVVGSPFLISLRGGDGTGAVTETLTGVSSLAGCAISNRFLTATEQKQGFCEVRVVKAGDQNYFAETQTAQLYFMAFINNMPSGITGSGATIGLNGITSVETSTVLPPSITGLSTLTLSKSAGGTFTITGTGFTGSISVKFWRNKVIVTTSVNGTSIDIPVLDIANSGATSGRIAVITATGEAVSVDSLTITP